MSTKKKEAVIYVRVTPGDLARYHKAAERSDRVFSDWVRTMLAQAATKAGVK